MKTRTAIWLITGLSLAAGLFLGIQKGYTFTPTPGPIMVTDELFLPYNIKTDTWWTGLYIAPESTASTRIDIEFYHGNDTTPYATVNKFIDGQTGWTGNVDQLLSNPASFKSPSNLKFMSDNHFTVTRFITNTGSSSPGFGAQTFFSYSAFDGWPFP